jgi:hypothetical protein
VLATGLVGTAWLTHVRVPWARYLPHRGARKPAHRP